MNDFKGKYIVEKVLFYEKNGKYYFKYNDMVVDLSEENLEKLKDMLTLPYALQFYGLKKIIIANIMFDMYNFDAESELKEYEYDKKNRKTRYAAIYRKKEKELTKTK